MERTRKNIALLCGDLFDTYCLNIIKGAKAASKELDFNLFIVPGKYYGTDLYNFDYRFEYQYNSLYSFINKNNVDAAVILLGAIGPFSDNPKERNYFEIFRKKFEGLPVVSIATKVDGWSFIKYDNKSAISEGIKYLVKNQQCHKIAMVTGEKTSDDAIERLNAYKETLLELDIPINDDLIIYGDFTNRVRSEIKKLIMSNPGLDAICFANDAMAIAAYDVMNELGLEVGRDIALLGFDDISQSVKMMPPLASVRADATELGYEAMRLAFNVSDFKTTKDISLPTKLIIRESMQRDIRDKSVRDIFSGDSFDISDYFDDKSKEIYDYLFDKYDFRINHEQVIIPYIKAADELKNLISKKTLNADDFSDFGKAVSDFFAVGCINNLDTTKFFRVFERIMEFLKKNSRDDKSKLAVSEATTSIFLYLTELIQNTNYRLELENTDTNHKLSMINKTFFDFESGSDQNYSTILSTLDILDINNSYLVLYKDPVTNLIEDDFKVPDKIYIKAVQNGSEVIVPPIKKQQTSVDKLYQDMFSFSDNSRKELVFLDLFYDEEQYGILIFDIPYEYFFYCESLTFQVSIAVRMLRLLKEGGRVREQLEGSLSLLRQNNIELNQLARLDELSKVYNRRGFFNLAQEMLDDKTNIDKYVLVVYADVDNLKIINDRFGHEGGDYAIINCSRILQEVYGDKGVIGRIGGDEFAIICVVDVVDAGEKLKAQLHDKFDALNMNSTKLFNIKMSLGDALYKIREGMDIKDLLDRADAMLYKEKKMRRKEILKSVVEK